MKKRMLSAFLCLCMVLTMVPAAFAVEDTSQKTIYVSNEGSDELGGGVYTPVKTLGKALDLASDGDTIYLRPGTYTTGEGSGLSGSTMTKAVSIEGSGSADTIIEGALKIAGSGAQSENTADISVSGITFRPAEDTQSVNWGLYFGNGWNSDAYMNNSDITVSNCAFEGWQYAICLQGGTVSSYTMSGNTLTVTDCTFTDVFCATSVNADSGTLDMDASEFDAAGPYYYAAQVFGSTEPNQGNLYYSTLDSEPVNVTIDNDNGRPAEGFKGFDVIILDSNGQPKSYAADINAALAQTTTENGDTIYLPAGEYDIGELNPNKAVNIVGAGAENTILNGRIEYQANSTASNENDSITVSGITLRATETLSHQGLAWNNYNTLSGYALNVKDCVFDGWKYAIGVNSGSANNTLNVSDTAFENTFCAMAVESGEDKNTIGTLDNVTTTEGCYAVQNFEGNGTTTNGYYSTVESYEADKEDGTLSAPDWDATTGDTTVPTSWEAKIGNKYGTLKELVESVSGMEPVTIELLNDITLDTAVNVPASSAITINGNDHTITFPVSNSGGSAFAIPSSAENVTFAVNDVVFKTGSDANLGADGKPITGFGILVGESTNNVSVTVDGCSFSDLWTAVYFGHVDAGDTGSVSITNSTYSNVKYGYSIDEVTPGTGVGAVEPDFDDSNTSEDEDFVTSEEMANIILTDVESGAQIVYNDLSTAISNADTGDTITLNVDVTGPITIDKSVTIEGNGHKITATGDSETAIKVTADNVTLNNVNAEGNVRALDAQSENVKTLTVIGGSYVASETYEGAGGAMMIGTFETAREYGTITIKDATLGGSLQIAGYKSGKLDITGNNISFKGSSPYVGILVYMIDTTADALEKNGITASSLNESNNIALNDNKGSDYTQIAKASASGGWEFPDRVSADNAIATINNNRYSTLQAAVNVVENNGEISLINDCDEDVTVSRAVVFTINPGEHSFTGSVSADSGYRVTRNENTYTVEKYTPSSSGGGGGGSSSYAVSVSSGIDNGSVTVSPKNASKGATVTITVTPDAGYELDTLTVKDASGNAINLTRKSDTTYTFEMPSGRVTVDATFAATSTTPSNPFTDVASNAYYADAVLWAVENDVTNGTSATTFSPNASCTRAQMVTFLWRASGSPEPQSTFNPFTDVASNAYYADAVLWAVENGITNGTSETTFSPDATVTRGQTVTFLYRDAGSPAASASGTFTDVAADAYYAAAVQWAVSEGVTNGMTSTTFQPNGDCTRAQIVTFLYRYLAA